MWPRPSPADIDLFYRRVAAFAVDIVILNLALVLIGSLLYGWTPMAGTSGRLIGLSLGLAYFALLSSRFTGGQTLGDRCLAIQIVGPGGTPLSPTRGLLRALIAATPLFFYNLPITEEQQPAFPVDFLLLSVINMGITFDPPPGARSQSIPDLVVSSSVVRSAISAQLAPSRPGLLHRTVMIGSTGLLVALIVVGLFAQSSPGLSQSDIDAIATEVAITTPVHRIEIAKLRPIESKSHPDDNSASLLIVALTPRDADAPDGATIEAAARAILLRAPGLHGAQRLTIQITHGFDLGYARRAWSYRQTHSAADWRLLVGP